MGSQLAVIRGYSYVGPGIWGPGVLGSAAGIKDIRASSLGAGVGGKGR